MRLSWIGIMAMLALASCNGSNHAVVQDPPAENPPEEFAITAFQVPNRWLEVSVVGGVGPYTVTVTEPAGLLAEHTEFETVDGQAIIHYSPIDLILGGGGLCSISAEDANGDIEQTDIFVEIEAIELKPDTLYAIPMQHEVRVGESVRVIVATGRTTHPLTSCGTTITFNADLIGDSLQDTFNLGSPGSGQWDADGVWSQISADNDFYFHTYYGSVKRDRLLGEVGRATASWYISPNDKAVEIEGATGSLFSFEVSFSEPGQKWIGIESSEVYSFHTYFYGLEGGKNFWSVLMADEKGSLHYSLVGQVSNKILVTE